MREPAKLTGELLARKGQALPTSGFAYPDLALGQSLAVPGRPALTRYGGTLAKDGHAANGVRLATQDRRQAPGRRAEDRVALTLRLDRDRHRRLRIFSARHEATSQEVIVKALDAYLAACGDDCACLRGETEDCIRN